MRTDAGLFPPSEPREIAPIVPIPSDANQAYAMAKRYFDERFPESMLRFETAQALIQKGDRTGALRELHRAAETLYQCVLLVSTFYLPGFHSLGLLREQAEGIEGLLVAVWPRATDDERARFERLEEAFASQEPGDLAVDAEALRWLSGCTAALGGTVRSLCSQRIAELKAKTDGA